MRMGGDAIGKHYAVDRGSSRAWRFIGREHRWAQLPSSASSEIYSDPAPRMTLSTSQKAGSDQRSGMIRARCPAAAARVVRLKKGPFGTASRRFTARHVPGLDLVFSKDNRYTAREVSVEEYQREKGSGEESRKFRVRC